jgi:hypothetical protein
MRELHVAAELYTGCQPRPHLALRGCGLLSSSYYFDKTDRRLPSELCRLL